MKDYNGFTGAQRDRAQRWLNVQWASGKLQRPMRCVACGQTEGVIDAHAEDYSEPFAAGKTDGFHLCFVCHMMVHCRHRNQSAWREYRQFVESGGQAKPFRGRDWPGFQKVFLGPTIAMDAFRPVMPPTRKALLEIELSQDKIAQRLGSARFSVTGR